jgi:hypothetical protein
MREVHHDARARTRREIRVDFILNVPLLLKVLSVHHKLERCSNGMVGIAGPDAATGQNHYASEHLLMKLFYLIDLHEYLTISCAGRGAFIHPRCVLELWTMDITVCNDIRSCVYREQLMRAEEASSDK